MPEGALLAARELVAGYLPGVPILRGCNLVLGEGEIVGIVGPNGAGKSTLLKAIFGLIPVETGCVEMRGEAITGLAAHELVRRGVGYVPQVDNIFPRLTVEENLKMGVYVDPKRYRERAEAVGSMFPRLLERTGQHAGSLSGGERQMLAMGRALMMDPAVLLLDEPSAGLSPKFQDDVFERVVQVNAAGVSVVMVEQNATQCLHISHRGYVLDQGTNAYTGSGEELLADPKVVELYLGTLARYD
jgi:branched-chain amino acid transport system ATP-binding protein